MFLRKEEKEEVGSRGKKANVCKCVYIVKQEEKANSTLLKPQSGT